MPFVDIITTRSWALDLEYKLVNEAETQRQNVSNILKTYFELYQSDPIPPHLYGATKADKPRKYFLVRIINTISTIDRLPYRLSKYVVDIIQLTPNRNQHKVENLTLFVSRVTHIELKQIKHKFCTILLIFNTYRYKLNDDPCILKKEQSWG